MTRFASIEDLRRHMSPDVAIVAEQQEQPATEAARELQGAQKQQLARRFEALWREAGGPELEPEYRFDDGRRWLADYAHVPSRTLIELEGGVWAQGRHTRGKGYIADCTKYNAAVMQGWQVLRLATGMVQPSYIATLVQWIGGQSDSVD